MLGSSYLSVCLSFCVSLHMEQLSSHWTDFHTFLYLSIFRKCIEKIQALLKCDKNKGYFTWRPMYCTWRPMYCTFMIISRWNHFKVRTVSDKFVQKIKTHYLYSKIFLRKSCHLWDNVQKYSRAGQAADDNIIGRMHFESWVTKAADTHSEYVILFAFSTITLVMRTRLDFTFIHKMPLFYLHEYKAK